MPLAISALGLLLASIGGIAYAGRPSDMEDNEEAGLLGNKENNKKLWHFAGEMGESLKLGCLFHSCMIDLCSTLSVFWFSVLRLRCSSYRVSTIRAV